MRFSQLVPWKHESVGRVLSKHQMGKLVDAVPKITNVINDSLTNSIHFKKFKKKTLTLYPTMILFIKYSLTASQFNWPLFELIFMFHNNFILPQ